MNINTDKYEQHINLLIKRAKNSAVTFKHAACIFKGNKIFASGVNKYFKIQIKNNNGEIEKHHLCIHAEIDCISGYKNVKGCDIMIIRVGKNDQLMNSRPCNDCIEKMMKKGIVKVYYSFDEKNIFVENIEEMEFKHFSAGSRFRQRRLETLN